jgi:Uri superfamily endonuclease
MKGTYCLIISMKKSEKLDIGHLHNMHRFKKGYYVYIGSAMNSLVPRLNRHLSDEKKMHWHIDYLLKSPDCHIRDILFNISEERIECALAESISKDGEEIPGFGCSDCSCSSHLIYFKRKRDALASTRNAYEKIDKDYHNLSYLKKKHKVK